MNESINMYSAIVRSMNPRNLLTTSKNGKIYWLKTIAILLTVFISISHKHLKKSMVCVVDQNKYVHVISLFSIKNWKNVMEWNINVLIWFLVGPTSCANRLSFLFFTTGPNVCLINTIDFYSPLIFPWIFDTPNFNEVDSFIPFAMLGFCSNNMLDLRLASNYSNVISPLALVYINRVTNRNGRSDKHICSPD